ncbi:DUF6276 family protein [Natronoglomus mannanivorans]|uniref:DUF6276 family protein n=1 Tax=Natronoglomus mannanivorans TaxID=2979990 RepID=A0AAP3E1I1_9EURY|nr:DUF6276 family protein [Halobacteria archaeon AArc-xg1-1]
MICSHCDRPTVDFAVPEAYRECVPDTATATMASICTHCLTVRSIEASGAGSESEAESEAGSEFELEQTSDDSPSTDNDPNFTRVSTGFPPGGAAIPFALLLGNCSSLATNRPAIETLLEDLERKGTDPLLAIDRLVAEPPDDLEPAIDLERRRHQLEGLFY